MNWTMAYPWRSRSDSVRRINMSSEPGNESFFCALRPIPRILSLRRRDCARQVQIGEPSRRTTISGCSRAPDAYTNGKVQISRPAGCRTLQQHHVRAFLYSFEDNFTTVRRDVEVANVEVG